MYNGILRKGNIFAQFKTFAQLFSVFLRVFHFVGYSMACIEL